MKILQIIPYFVPAWEYGGPIPVCYELSKKLVENGHDVTVCTTDALDSKNRIQNKQEIIDGIKVVRFSNISNYFAWKHNLFYPLKFKSYIKNNLKNFDIVHLHGYRTYSNIVSSQYCFNYGIPYVLQPHGTTYIVFKKQGLKRLFDKRFGYKIIEKANVIISLNETKKIQIEKMGAEVDKIKIIPNGIDIETFNKIPDKGTFRNKYSISEGDRLILYVGRIHKSKGIDILINSFAKLQNNLSDSKLALVGPDDGYIREMKKIVNNFKINDNVIFTGFVDAEIKNASYIDADVFVTPDFTGFPITFLEAMFFGLPIITTNRGDKLDWIHNNVGFVVDFDRDQLVDAITKIISDKKLMKKFKEQGRNMLKYEFNWDKIAKKIESIYMDCI